MEWWWEQAGDLERLVLSVVLAVPGQFLLFVLLASALALPVQVWSGWEFKFGWWGLPLAAALHTLSTFIVGRIPCRANPRQPLAAIRWTGGSIVACWSAFAVAMFVRDLTSPRPSAAAFDRTIESFPLAALMILTAIAGMYLAYRRNFPISR